MCNINHNHGGALLAYLSKERPENLVDADTCRRGEWLDGRTYDVGAVVRETVDYRDATAA